MASVGLFKRGGVVWVRYPVKGQKKPDRKHTPFKVDAKGRIPKEAYEWLNNFALKLANGMIGIETAPIVEPMRLSLLMVEHGNALTRDDRPQSASTKSNSQSAVDKYTTFNGSDPFIHEITKERVVEFRTKLISEGRIKPSTLHLYVTRLSTMLDFAVNKKWIAVNPITSDINRKPKTYVACPYTDAEIERIFNHTHEHDLNLNFQLRYIYYTACRGIDSCLAKPGWVDYEEEVVKTWNQKLRRFDHTPLYRQLEELFEEMKQAGVFNGYPHGFQFHYTKRHSLFTAVSRLLDKLGIDHARALHSFKYTAAKRARKIKGMPLELRAVFTHHNNPATLTGSYDHYDREDMKELKRLFDGDNGESNEQRLVRENRELKARLQELETKKLRLLGGGRN